MRRTSSRTNLVNLNLNQYSQSNTSRTSTSIVYFVIPTGLTAETCSPRLISAKELYVDFNLYSEWLPEHELLYKIPQSNNVYVLDPFSGRAYDYLKEHFAGNKKFMIIGPQCINYAVQQQELQSPIQSKGYPFCSLAMQNICITLSGFSKAITAELSDLVQKMNGVLSKAYSSATTHVVAENTLTAKCTEAYKNDIPVMTCDWIKAVWTDCQDELIDATDAKFLKYNCPIFHNIKFCVSQVSLNVQAALERTITSHGGIYLKEIEKDGTDVLVTPFASSEKYKVVQELGVMCVTLEWIDQSIQAGHVLPFDKFHPQQPPSSPTTPEQSCFTDFENPERIPVPDNKSKKKPAIAFSAIQDKSLDFLRKAPAGFLHGCTIYICGQDRDDEKIDELCEILNSCGVAQSDKITDQVSHVVVTTFEVDKQDTHMIEVLDNIPYIVSYYWLLQSAKEKRPADEEPFTVGIPRLEKKMSRVKAETSAFETVTSVVPEEKVTLPSRREKIGHLAAGLDSGLDIERTPSKHPVRALKELIMSKATSTLTEKSPRLKKRRGRYDPERLKKALAFQGEASPETMSVKRRWSTPMQKVGTSLLDELEEKIKRRKEKSTSCLDLMDQVVKVDHGNNVDGITDTPPKVLHDDNDDDDDVPHSHQEDFENETKTETEQFTTTTTTTTIAVVVVDSQSGNDNNNSTGGGTTKNSAATAASSKIYNRAAKVSSQIAREKFGVLRDLNKRGRRQNPDDLPDDLEVDWTDKMKANAESMKRLEMTGDELQDPLSCINDNECEIVQINNPPAPEGRQTQEKQKEESHQKISANISTNNNRRDEIEIKKLKNKNSSQSSYVFTLSGCLGVEKTTAKNIIEELGGIASALDIYDKTADVVIAYKVVRSEKILGGISAGLPILHPKYVTACQDAKALLQFDNFTLTEDDCTSPSEKNLARAAQSWYQKILMDPCSKPFSKFRVYLSELKSAKKMEACQQLIEAGGGKVFTTLDGINIVLGEGKEAVGQAALANVSARTPKFLNDVILMDADVSWLA